MNSCVNCGLALPSDQGSNTCSMCYGDPEHGKDGYYQQWLTDAQFEAEELRRMEDEAAENSADNPEDEE